MTKHQDLIVFWLGIVCCVLLTALIIYLEPYQVKPQLLPDQGASWYYWKLSNPQAINYLKPWFGFFVHQLLFWVLLYRAKQNIRQTSDRVTRYNYWALMINIVFVFAHMLQTQIWYDGLAQTTPVWSSQSAVAILLIWVLLMENNRRGLFFGKKIPISQAVIGFARRNHGYYFSWAIIYTFWFHPVVNTTGHLAGFFYLYLLLLQSSLFFTRIHSHRWWTFTLEFIVLIHGTLVAINQPIDIWPMFAFGFGGILVITQMHGIGLGKWSRFLLLMLYISLVAMVYSERSLFQLNELIRIPFIDYLGVLILIGLFSLCIKIGQWSIALKSG